MKPTMYQGNLNWYFPFEWMKENIKAMGIIHNARVSLTVVAIFNASAPKALAAPTTELVS